MKTTNYSTNKSGTKHSVIAVACENCHHIMVVTTSRSVTSFKTLAAMAKELITECPVCGEKVPVKEKLSVYGYISEHQNAAEELDAKLRAEAEEKLQEELSKLTEKPKKTEDLPPENTFAQNIRGDIPQLKQYLDTLIQLETESRFVITRILSLNAGKLEERSQAVDHQKDAITKSRRANTIAANKAKEFYDEIENLETDFAKKDWEKLVKVKKPSKPREPEYLDETLPKEPVRPVLKTPDKNGVYPHEPKYPVLKTPGLFNKKKVQEENERLIAQYEAAVADHRRACEEQNKKRLIQYEMEMGQWQKKCAALEEIRQKNEELRTAYALKLQKYEAALAQRQEAVTSAAEQLKAEARVELDQKIADIRRQIEEKVGPVQNPQLQLQVTALFDAQMAVAKEQLKAISEEKHRLYSLNVIYPTYRELEAISSFFEYFNSGRCETLDGVHGAYNLFESECRSDVAARLIRTLEEVKQGQVILYRQISRILELKKELEEALEKAIPQIRKIPGEKMDSYIEENRAKGAAAAKKEKPDSKEPAPTKYFRLSAVCEAKTEACIAEAKKITF